MMQNAGVSEKAAVAAVICAAGKSTRMNTVKKKEYLPYGKEGMTVLGASVTAFALIPEIESIVITVPDDPMLGEDTARKALPAQLLEKDAYPKILFVKGGKTRQESVFNALTYGLDGNAPDYVLIHDGARPWVSTSLIRKIIEGAKKHGAVIPILPITDTPKETEIPLEYLKGNEPVLLKRHLKRSFTGIAQTPQGFSFPEILDAYRKAQAASALASFTDDAEVWAAFYGGVWAVQGEPENRKITFPEDLS